MFEKTRQTIKGIGPDPVDSLIWTVKIGRLEIRMEEYFSDVSTYITYGSHQLLFTSVTIKPTINGWFESYFKKLEDEFNQVEDERYDRPTFCFHCGSSNLREVAGYIGEDIIACNDCHEVLWEEPVTMKMLESY